MDRRCAAELLEGENSSSKPNGSLEEVEGAEIVLGAVLEGLIGILLVDELMFELKLGLLLVDGVDELCVFIGLDEFIGLLFGWEEWVAWDLVGWLNLAELEM